MASLSGPADSAVGAGIQVSPCPVGDSSTVNPGGWSLCERKKVASLSAPYRTALGRVSLATIEIPYIPGWMIPWEDVA